MRKPKRAACLGLALLVLAPGVARAANLTLICEVLAVHGDGTQTSFRRKIEVATTSLLYKQSDDHGSGYQIVGNGTLARLDNNEIVLRDDKTIYWAIARDGSYYLKNHVTDAVQMGKCKREGGLAGGSGKVATKRTPGGVPSMRSSPPSCLACR